MDDGVAARMLPKQSKFRPLLSAARALFLCLSVERRLKWHFPGILVVNMNCAIYKSDKKPDYYLYIARVSEKEDDLSCLPDALAGLLGQLEFVMQLELSDGRKLAQADVGEVMESVQKNGYYLQTPPRAEIINQIENSKL